MKSNKRNSNRNDKPKLINWDPIASVEEMVEEAVKDGKVKKEEAKLMIRYLQHYLVMQLESNGEADYFGMGLLKKVGDEDDKIDYIFKPYQDHEEIELKEPDIPHKKGIDGSEIHIGKTISMAITLNFPVEKAVKLMAKKRGVPAEKLEEDFIEQFDKAYNKMIKADEGFMPDFGALRYTDRKTGEFSIHPLDEFNDCIREFKSSSLELYTGTK